MGDDGWCWRRQKIVDGDGVEMAVADPDAIASMDQDTLKAK